MSDTTIGLLLVSTLYFLLIYAAITEEGARRRGWTSLRAPHLLAETHASRCADQATPLDGGTVHEVREDDPGDRDSEEARHARGEVAAWEPDPTIGVDQFGAERRARLKALQEP